MSSSVWKTAGVSVPGFSHLAEGAPCQDAHQIVCFEQDWFIGVVADGAGSAKYGEAGAAIACEMLATSLAERLDDPGCQLTDPVMIAPWIIDGIALVRERLQTIALNDDATLDDYHATLLGAVAGPRGGMLFHIGDGAAMALTASIDGAFVLSAPENGEYAETTFFLTQDYWRAHLRLSPFGPEQNLLLLMTDGVTPLALRGAQPFPQFVGPLSAYLEKVSREKGEAALAATLSKDEVRRITDDDKTLVWALRESSA